MADLRKMVGEPEPEAEAAPKAEPAKVEEPKTETPETKTAEAEPAKTPEPDEGTGEKKQEPPAEEDEHVKLPPAAQKKVDKEIARTVSARKEADEIVRRLREQEKSLSGKQGTEPVKPAPEATTSPDKPVRPVAPVQPIFGSKDQTWAEYENELKAYHTAQAAHEVALAKYETERDEWLVNQARSRFEQEQSAKQHQESHKAAWDAAVEAHGDEFPEAMERLTARIPEPVQLAISQLENWPTVAMHLESNPDALKQVVDLYGRNPFAAVAQLGAIEASLQKKAEPKVAKPIPKQDLPAPPASVGGTATPSASVDLEKCSFKVFKRGMGDILKRDN